MIDRIRQLIVYSGLSSSQFADGIEVPRAILSHILSGRNKPSLDVILKVAAKYSEVSLEWLLLGEGEMLKQLAEKRTVEINKKVNLKPVEPAAETIATTNQEQDKVQIKHPVEVPLVVGAAAGKQVKQIVFFYTDNSFSVFNPEL